LIFSILDIGIAILFAVLLFAGLLFFKTLKKDNTVSSFFVPAFLIKVIGAVFFIILYINVYGGLMDSERFFNGSTYIFDLMAKYPGNFWDILLADSTYYSNYLGSTQVYILGKGEDLLFVKLLTILSILSFKNYLLVALLMMVFNFLTSWFLFKTLVKRYSHRKFIWVLFTSVFLLPSVFFWSGALLKDSLVLSLFFLLITLILRLNLQNWKVLRFVWIGLLIFFLLKFKAYVVISFIPAVIVWMSLSIRNRIQNKFARGLIVPMVLILGIAALFPILQFLGNETERYKLDELESRVKGFHTWHTSKGGSNYSLGQVEYTAAGALKKAPVAISITLFRPFPWEVKNGMMLIGAVEGFLFLCLFVYLVFIKIRFFTWIKTLYDDPFLLASLIFVLVFAFAVGFTSYNYGALFRYKIQCMPFFFLILTIPYIEKKLAKSV
jgi:hypothetical protein